MERTCRWHSIAASLFACAAVSALPHAAQAAPPIQVYGALPGVELVRLSPSGQRVAMIGVIGEERRLVIISADNKLLKSGVIGDSKVRDLNWAGDDHEDHFLSREATRIAMLTAAVDFVQKYDPAQ